MQIGRLATSTYMQHSHTKAAQKKPGRPLNPFSAAAACCTCMYYITTLRVDFRKCKMGPDRKPPRVLRFTIPHTALRFRAPTALRRHQTTKNRLLSSLARRLASALAGVITVRQGQGQGRTGTGTTGNRFAGRLSPLVFVFVFVF